MANNRLILNHSLRGPPPLKANHCTRSTHRCRHLNRCQLEIPDDQVKRPCTFVQHLGQASIPDQPRSMGQRPASAASNRTSFQQAPATVNSAAAYASGGSVPGSGSYSLYGYAAQQKRQSNGFYPAQIAAPPGGQIRAPPGAAAPANVYERRFT